ncbi:hypothetical protein K505DRAFT_328343 [Melanomma pulvis-pyrius CBS 109.77]|uniref:DUF3128 domain-containing protein n=1 Tax=Melanomma pulvis-pyrius CBS 109.77 TaxID=1314802 RepID=A0A6A6WZ95_9PLEO|nr:hypothetical protein K505DRAFT_328343 [Melanomma pulvis-pyrius CBS 109.77]
MGWFSSSPSTDVKPTAQQLPTPTSPPAQLQPQPQPELQSQPPPPPQPPIDPDADFHAAFPHLAPTPADPNAPRSPPPPSLNSHQTTATSDLTSYPTTMSCSAAFDSAFYCSSLGGHFNDIYRYGQLRSCSEHWADWRFCMGLKSKSAEAKREAVQDRYRDKEEKVRGKKNSEDVWERRGPGESIVGAFSKAEEEGRRVEKS